jgi:YfiH family protein
MMREKIRGLHFSISNDGIYFYFPWGTKAIFFFKNHFPDFNVVLPKQNHTANILFYPDDFSGNGDIFFDGIIAPTSLDIALGVKTADCLPVAFSNSHLKLKGIIHAGWRGLARNIIQEATDKMRQLGEKSISSTYFVIGPHICGKCYEVGSDVAEIFETLCKEDGINVDKVVKKGKQKGKFFISLSSFAYFLLRNLGIKNIFISGICVKEDNRFFSRRRGDEKSQISIVI